MARTSRRIYSKRRKRSPNKMFAPQNTGPKIEYSAEEMATARSRQQSQLFERRTEYGSSGGGLAGLFAKTQQPAYLGGKETGGSGVGGGKTYTITEA